MTSPANKRSPMKYALLFCLLGLGFSLTLFSCKSQKARQADYAEIARRGESSTLDLRLLTRRRWKHVRSMDEYNGEWNEVEEGQRETINFLPRGGYTQKHPENPEYEGSFTLVGEKGLNVAHSGNKALLNFTVEELEKKKLVLSIPGRHGKVFREYKSVK